MSVRELNAAKSVYGYYFPEVRTAIDKLLKEYPHHVFLRWCEPGGLDHFHDPIIERYIAYQNASVPDLRNFSSRYPTAGSEEGIREFLTWLQSKKVKRIYVLEGEYEGYKAVATTRCIKTIEVSPETNPATLKRGYWFLSNPSARNGNIIPDEFIERICDAGHKVFYDLTYVGLTNPHRFDLGHPNIIAVVASFSKPFGLFSYRIGFALTKEEIPSLYGNIWFKSIPSLLIAEKVMAEIGPTDITKKYKPIQKQIIGQINETFNLGMKVSDALLLGHLTREDAEHLNRNQLKIIEPFKRGKAYRFCLTPYFQQQEK